MAAGERQEQKFRAACWGLRTARRRQQIIANSFSATMLCMGQITAVVVLYISGNEVLAGAISIGSALTLRLLAETATAPFVVLGDQYSQAITAHVSWKRLEEPFAVPVLPAVDPDAAVCPPLDGAIVFDHVDFAYPHTGRQVLRDVSFTAAEAAVRAVGAADVLGLLPGGLDEPVEEDGTNLTTAQRQLIALARAWLTHPDMLVLDEATSALDAPLERAVIAAVGALGCTTLMVTHREDVVRTADEVVVLSDGQVVQIGAPAALRRSGGPYDDLWGIATNAPAVG
jgi:ABC-type bacteriocin/lantibiotic exporter with double-glycine peptidase domain